MLLGGLSDIVVVVAHIVPSPGSGLLATQPDGNAGAVTLSRFSMHGPAEGLGLADGEGVGDGDGVPPGVGVGNGPLAKRSYISTKPTPVPLFTPESKAVYCPGANVAQIAASRGLVGARPIPTIMAAQVPVGSSIQLSFA